MIARRIPDSLYRSACAVLLLGCSTIASAASDPPENAALLYDDISLRLWGSPTDPDRTRLLDADAEGRIADLLAGGAVTAEVRADMARVREVLELANRAATLTHYDRGLDFSDGFVLLLPHLSAMRQTARLMMADATIRFADGDSIGAAETLGASLALANHVSSDRIIVSTLVSAAIASLGSQHLQRAIDHGEIHAEEAAVILSQAERLDSIDPFGLRGALDGEVELIRNTVNGVFDSDPRFDDQFLHEDLVDEETGIHTLYDRPTDEILTELAAVESLYGEVADVIQDPDPEVARQRLAEIEDRIAAGEGGSLMAMLAPSFTRIFEGKARAESSLQEPLAQLREIAAGTKRASDFTNAAIWLRQAAQAASSLHADEQRLIEAIRVAPDAFDDAENQVLRMELQSILDRHRDAITAPLLAAAEAGRCRFDADPFRRHNIAMSEFLAGIRGAVRFHLVDLLWCDANTQDDENTEAQAPDNDEEHTGAPPSPSPSAVTRVAPMVRIIELISDDARLAHSMLATAILDDLVAAMPAVLAKKSSDPESIIMLRDAVATIDRTDLLGHRRGLEQDQQVLIRFVAADGPTRERRAALAEQLNASQVFAVALALQAFVETEIVMTPEEVAAARSEERPIDMGPKHDLEALASEHPPCTHFDRGPLLSFRDLYDADACAALFARRVDIGAAAPVLRVTRGTPRSVRDPLGGLTVPTVVDMSHLAHRAISLLDELDQMIRRAARSQSSP